ncbi:MAG: glycosyltransferase [Gallionella sp.]
MPSVEYLGLDKPINKVSPLVSVCIPTYQHASYIAQCLDSVLSQEANFSIEILVGEDQSTDGTREICIAYADKFPDKIRLFLNDRNDVVLIDGRPSGKANFLNLYYEARGEFIAICEGDDYWTDKSKLARQVAIFREIPSCSLVFHNALIVGNSAHGINFSSDLAEGLYDIENVISKPWFVPSQSMLFRKDLLELGDWFKHIYNGDYVMQLLLATKFPFYYVDRMMSAYRVHGGGTSRGRKILYHPIKVVETLSIFNCFSEFKYDHLIKKRLDDIRSGMLVDARAEILRSTILGMSYWEKVLTFRFYTYVFRYLINKLANK